MSANFLDALDSLVAEKHLLKHPFYVLWTEGRLTRENLREYAVSYYPHVAAFPRYVSGVHSNCEDAVLRSELLENLIEEERGADNHPELWTRFCEGLGLTREQIAAAAPLPGTGALLETFFGLTRRHWTEGLAALYAYESQVPEVAQTKLEGLARFYGVSDARATAFFEVHRTADRWHREVSERILEKHVPPEREESVVAAASSAAGALHGFLDSFVTA
jgi:pyrroloquinoline-quinone synthase